MKNLAWILIGIVLNLYKNWGRIDILTKLNFQSMITLYLSIYLDLLSLPFFKKDYIYLFLERGPGKEKEKERNNTV